jgi:hypothetical protein
MRAIVLQNNTRAEAVGQNVWAAPGIHPTFRIGGFGHVARQFRPWLPQQLAVSLQPHLQASVLELVLFLEGVSV